MVKRSPSGLPAIDYIPPLAGMSVLIVEDEIIIGMMLANEITLAGGTAIGPMNTVASALKEIESGVVNAVILDAKLVDGSGADLAASLEKRRIPYVVVSGYDRENLPQGLRRAPFMAKPISMPLLVEAIGRLAAASRQASVTD